MSWEDDELREIETLKQSRARNEKLMLLRETMRREQCQARWIELQREIRSLVITFNQKAERTLLRILDAPPTELHVRREDGVLVDVNFGQELYRVNITYRTCPGHNRSYVLWVMPVNGNETAVWVDQQGNESQTDQAIAARTIRTLLGCGL
jgi:hypothetical protein